AGNCWRSAIFSTATARWPRQINPIDRRTTISAVSISDPVAYSGENQSAGHGGRVLAKHNLWNCGYFYGAGIIADDLYLAPFKTSPAILLGGVWDDSEVSPPTNQVYVSIDCDAYSKPHCVVGFNCRRSHNGC